MNAAHLKIVPRVSEQTYELAAQGVYVFNVPTDASKQQIKQAIENQYEVTVTKLNTAVLKGKKMPSARRRSQPVYGARASIKKAYVTLAKGDKITVFEEVEA